MLRTSICLALILSVGACFELGDDEFQEDPYEIRVEWTTANPPEGMGVADVTYGDDSLEVIGYSGSMIAYGLAPYGEHEVTICVALARRYTQTIDGREVPIYEPLAQQCDKVSVFENRVSFRF
jgi:hypothetical protein